MKSEPIKSATMASLAAKKVLRILRAARTFPTLRRLGPKTDQWKVDVQIVNRSVMSKLNGRYRQKPYATDVLSFPVPAFFSSLGHTQGLLGELVICSSVLKAQAQELKHPPEIELEVLLVHGILHLLGMDHERSTQEAKKMALWEAKLLKSSFQRPLDLKMGLIDRSGSGIE